MMPLKVNIVDGPLCDGTPARAKYRLARSDNGDVRVRIVDADSPTFGADFCAAFAENVRRVRRDNKAVEAGA